VNIKCIFHEFLRCQYHICLTKKWSITLSCTHILYKSDQSIVETRRFAYNRLSPTFYLKILVRELKGSFFLIKSSLLFIWKPYVVYACKFSDASQNKTNKQRDVTRCLAYIQSKVKRVAATSVTCLSISINNDWRLIELNYLNELCKKEKNSKFHFIWNSISNVRFDWNKNFERLFY
jgi:hypothetical protein